MLPVDVGRYGGRVGGRGHGGDQRDQGVGAVVGQCLHAQRHTDQLPGLVSNEQEGVRLLGVAADPVLGFGRDGRSSASGRVRAPPYSDRLIDLAGMRRNE